METIELDVSKPDQVKGILERIPEDLREGARRAFPSCAGPFAKQLNCASRPRSTSVDLLVNNAGGRISVHEMEAALMQIMPCPSIQGSSRESRKWAMSHRKTSTSLSTRTSWA